jgi:ATP/maltotriose-dependent transcriptional regulator MalT
MKQQVDWAMDRPDEYQAQDWQTRSAEFSGELRKAREFDDHAVELAAQHNFKEITANLITARAVSDATFGVCERTNQTTAKALSLARSKAALLNAAEAFAICGQASQAQSLMDEVSKQFPRDTLLNTVWLPLFRAQLEMHRGKASQASELLEPTRRYELVGGFWPQYLRGQAFLSQRKGTEAAAEFQKILDHRGWYPNSPLYPLAHLGLARALTMTSNVSGGRKAYQDFFAIWKDADADLPILIEARREYRRLQEKRFDSWLEVIVKTYPQALGKQIVFEYNEAVANIWLRKLK